MACNADVPDGMDGSGLGVPTSGPAAPDDPSAEDSDDGSEPDASTGSAPEPNEPRGVRCDKIDFLFVVETPWTYKNNEYPSDYWNRYAKLREGFARIVSDLYITLEVDDFRVLVTGSAPAPEEAWCYPPDGTDPEYPNQDDAWCQDMELDGCDTTLGAGRNGIAIPGWGIEECMPERYLESGHPALDQAFACVMEHEWWHDEWWWWAEHEGYVGDDRLMDAMTAALGDLADPGQCNAGFLRDDALLVIVLVELGGDGQPDSSSGTPDSWRDAVLAAKKNEPENVVVLALAPDGDLPQSLCAPTESDALGGSLRTFVEGFAHGKIASSCLPDYVPFFSAGAEVIDAACEEFIAPG